MVSVRSSIYGCMWQVAKQETESINCLFLLFRVARNLTLESFGVDKNKTTNLEFDWFREQVHAVFC